MKIMPIHHTLPRCMRNRIHVDQQVNQDSISHESRVQRGTESIKKTKNGLEQTSKVHRSERTNERALTAGGKFTSPPPNL